MSIPATVHNRIVCQGTTEKLRFRSVSPAVPSTYFAGSWIVNATGAPLAADQLIVPDLTGKKVRAALRKKHTDPVAAITFNEANGNVFLDPLTGVYGIDFRPQDTSPLKATDDEYARDDDDFVYLRCTKYVYDIELFDPITGEVSRPIAGAITLVAEATR